VHGLNEIARWGIRVRGGSLSIGMTSEDMNQIDRSKLVADTAALDDFNRNIVEEFRANGGKVGGPFEGGTLLLLHTTGSKSGRQRLSPLAYKVIETRC
jgi:hypothetical protein